MIVLTVKNLFQDKMETVSEVLLYSSKDRKMVCMAIIQRKKSDKNPYFVTSEGMNESLNYS